MPELTNNVPSNTESNNTLAELEVRSEEVQEIIGRPPHWLIRWGITAFFGVLALVLLSAAVIKYPEVIEAPIRLTAINAPQSLESRTGGKIIRLVTENNSAVDEGAVLAWLESTADHREILELAELTGHLRDQLLDSNAIQSEAVDLSAIGNLGELQTTFQGFEQAWREFSAYQPGAFYSRQRDMLIQELEYSKQLLGQLQKQKQIQQADLALAKREFDMQKELAANDFVSPVELARAERELASRRLPLQQTESAIISNHVSRTAKKKEIIELDRRMDEQQSIIIQSLNTLISAIDDWKQTYLVTAPYPGRVVYAGIVQENQTVSAGQELFYLKPNSTTYFGELSVSQQSFGRVSEGQQVLVRFSGYPYQEYGSVYGEVEYFSDFPVRDSLFFAKVAFPDGLQTSYGQTIPPRNGMLGQAEIITQDMRLLERVYNNITKELR
ncbi:MAG: HlyD family efflux transporter periplasmic adaptor subunit [Bacteroidetes bacterium]|jgi:HlyD family secretion protein|nr:HlyD family efflux transporter periplasmic adaptor subunit [Bacteroidota bacterium]